MRQKPFEFKKPKTTLVKPFSFMQRAQKPTTSSDELNSSEIVFKGKFKAPQVKTKRTISRARLDQLAQPRKRGIKKEEKVEIISQSVKPKPLEKVKKMLRAKPELNIKSTKPATIPVRTMSNMEKRAQERRELKIKRDAEAAKLQEEKAKLDEIKKAEEIKEQQELRKKLGHQPAPIRQYKPIERVKRRQPTIPVTPIFRTAKRKREENH